MTDMAGLTAKPTDGVLNAIIESPAGSTAKIKWDPKLELFVLSRPLPLGMSYPHDWGFVPGTKAADGDPLDVLVLSEGTSYPGLLIPCRPIGVVLLEQNRKHEKGRERNDRVVAVPSNAPRREVEAARDLPARIRDEIEQFFLNATFFESKDAEIVGWGGPADAWRLIEASRVKVRARPRSRRAKRRH